MKILKIGIVTAFIALFSFYSTYSQNLVTTDTSKVIIFTTYNSRPLNLDFDKDGLTDIVIADKSNTCGDVCISYWTEIECYGNFSTQDHIYEEYDTINNNYEWCQKSPYCTYILKGDMCTGGLHGCLYLTTQVGNWYDRTIPGFIGIRKIDSNDTIAGWIKIDISNSDPIVQYAFEKGHLLSLKSTNRVLPFKIYPCLTNDFINIDGDLNDICNFIIYNNFGQVILQGKLNSNNNKLSLKSLKTGIYYIRINNNQLQATTKIIKI